MLRPSGTIPDDAIELPLVEWNERIDKAIEDHLATGRSRDQQLLCAIVIAAAKKIGLGVLKPYGVVHTEKPYLPSRDEPGHWTFDAKALVASLRRRAQMQAERAAVGGR